MKEEITQLKEAQPCVPPCGAAGAIPPSATSRWTAQLPEEEVAYSWKFAEGGACPAAPSPPACGHPAAPHPGPVSLPRAAGGPREPGADPAGAGQAPRDLLLRDQARPAPPGAALLLPQRDAAAPAQRGRAPGLLPGSAELDGQGGGRGRALEAEPGRAAGPARGADAEQPVPARAGCGLPVSESDPAWVVSPRARTAPAFLSFLPQTPESRSRPSSLPRVQAPRPSSLRPGSPAPRPSSLGPSTFSTGSPGPQTLLPQTRESSPQTLLPRTLHLQHRESRPPDPPPSDSGVQVPRPSSLGPSSLSPGSPGPQTLLPRTQESSHQTLLSRTRESRSPDPPPSDPGVQVPRPSSLRPGSPAPRPSSLGPSTFSTGSPGPQTLLPRTRESRSPDPPPLDPPPSAPGVQVPRPSSLGPRSPATRPSSLGPGSPGPQTLLPQPRESRPPDPPPSNPGVQPPDPPPSDLGIQAILSFKSKSPGPIHLWNLGVWDSRTHISGPQPPDPTPHAHAPPCFPRMLFRWYVSTS
ncbi:sperm acrosome membrane-associated protein 6 isoform X3 [Choloepus didactylus]|uniref:sperm acrosome membrane-associated protein 6 isoform X3 n=1 Tax=Choloepus didactylus TaxID=27675 RepID=UPI00189E2387|nr:sperm acrosome membrane-associated protein 6 isoform X3 [Choloepus didactylus]